MASLTYAPSTLSGTTTTWLPITSAWPSVAACQTIVWNNPVYTQYNDVNDPGYGILVDKALTCLPPVATTWWESQPNDGVNTYNLGPIVCPSAYSTATTSTKGIGSTWVACCPSSYLFKASSNGGDIGECISTIIPGQMFNVAKQTLITSGNVVASAWGISVSTVSAGGYMSAVHLNGWNIAAQTSSSSSGSSPSPTSSSSVSSTSPGTNSKPTDAGGGGGKDNTGRNVGIGVGVGLGTLGVLCAVGAWWYVRRRGKAAENAASGGANNPWEGMAGGPSMVQQQPSHEISGKQDVRYEMDAPRK